MSTSLGMKLVIAINICLLLSGCFPVVENIFRPEADGGVLRETSCGYNQGPGRWDKIELAKDGITVSMQFYELDGNPRLAVSFSVPDGATLQLLTPTFTWSNGERTEALKPDRITWSSWKSQDLNTAMIGATELVGLRSYPKEYYLNFPTPLQKSRTAFTVELPGLKLNQRAIAFPPVRFVPAKAAYLAGYC